MKKSNSLSHIKVVLLLMSLSLTIPAFSQKKEFKLWDKIPDEIVSKEYTEIVDKDKNGVADGVRKVTEPTLTTYRAPAEKSNGTSVIICPGGGYGMLAINSTLR